MNSLQTNNVTTVYAGTGDESYELKICSRDIPNFDNALDDIDILSNIEREYFFNCVTKKRRAEFLYGRLVAKLAINDYLDNGVLRSISIEKGVFNYPIVKKINKSINVSISHSEGKVIAIAYPEEFLIGIDIEKIKKNNINIISMFEVDRILIERNYNNLKLTEEHYATIIWSSKEAIAKALRIGFTANIDIFAISNIAVKEKWYEISFESFSNFVAYSFLLNEYVITVACPKSLIMNWESFALYLLRLELFL
ncbi:hypothetical protein C7B63_11735 [Bacillus halotolerans]|uniref:4'-phosphopantetheinyl transferase family protein n=1 Tax=Bacillus subtilis group TaxID=653685 RepID=UPI000D01A53E|nr:MULTISPECIES: 4'-phosphopantetheinyl transferase superfamily protein [Bacillus subtilis group]MCO8149074.1 4'-phosphopantetheinyl transferase superfamily protein [Bacillus subtilis]MDQ4710329.1 4'-phosphopantetheinyl transferase superfamily protein [Bacillus subtilis]MEC2180489.1 4'-phosphopantetheinyl transferase superfamily protein [Bacillus subtilis]PRP50343.1 hypothetical protein C7B63_11735 [Bacillus halotolerans]PRP58749.1 hypothetical protein C7B66_10265 [Bacillus halotolerans]